MKTKMLLACAALTSATNSVAAQSPMTAPVNATPLTAAETEAIRGQGLPAWAVKLAIKTVRNQIGFAAAARLERLLSGDRVPTYREYQRVFGTKTAVILMLLPGPLKPKIAQ